jgi:hypothetical protein
MLGALRHWLGGRRLFTYARPDGATERVKALTVFLVNRRHTAQRFYADVCFIFQARVEVICSRGFHARHDLSGVSSNDEDHVFLDGNLFPGHESPPSLPCGDRDSEIPVMINDGDD